MDGWTPARRGRVAAVSSPSTVDVNATAGGIANRRRGSDEIDLREVVRTVWRRKLVVLTTAIMVTGIAAAIVFQLTPRFTATALLMMETRHPRVVAIEEVVPALTEDGGALQATIDTQVEILQARSLARSVIAQLDLANDPEFNPALGSEDGEHAKTTAIAPVLVRLDFSQILPSGWVDAFRRWMARSRAWGESLYSQFVGRREAGPTGARSGIEPIIDNFLSNLTVAPLGRTYIISVQYESEDTAKAALIANTIVELYLVDQIEAKNVAAREATTWLSERITELRRSVIGSEIAVESYRAKAELVGSGGFASSASITITDQQLSGLNSTLVTAKTDVAAAEARLRQIERLLTEPGAIESAPEVLDSSLVQRLKEQEIGLVRRKAELSQMYRAQHPTMINLRAELGDLRGKIKLEIGRVVRGILNEVEVARARKMALETELSQLQQKVAVLDHAEVNLRELERVAQATRDIYKMFLQRLNETSQQQGLAEPDARVVSRASAPTIPSFPRKSLLIGLASVASLFLGVLFVLLIENWYFGFRSREEIEGQTGIRVLGIVPALRGNNPLKKLLHRRGRAKFDPAFHEGIRRVSTAVTVLRARDPIGVLLVTSSVPNEGKTLLSVAVALQVARSGKKCVLVDCDFRCSRMHSILGLKNRRGLSELLCGSATLDDVVRRDEESGLHIINAGMIGAMKLHSSDAPDARDILPALLGSARMKSILKGLASRYDLVILDSPPVMVVSEAPVLSRLADSTIFVIRWEHTRRNVALEALGQLVDAGADVAGIVLSRVNTQKYSKYSFADSQLYSTAYRKYY